MATSLAINYALAGRFAEQVRALAIVESGEQSVISGDSGRAFGILQMHPATFADYYGRSKDFPKAVTDTWTEAQIKACASFLSMWNHLGIDLVIQSWNQGVSAVIGGVRVPEYLAKYDAAMNKIRAGK